MSTDYRSLSAEQLLDALSWADRTPDPDLIRACLERREELTPGLLAMLADSGDETWDNDDPRWYAAIHAGLLLIAFSETAALPIFSKVLRDEEQENLWEWFGTELAAYGPAVTQMAIDILNDRSTHEYARIASTSLLTALAWNYPSEGERILLALRAQLPPVAADGIPAVSPEEREKPDEVWGWVALALAELHDTVSRPQIIALYEWDLIDEIIMGDADDYQAIVDSDEPPSDATRPFNIIQIYESLHSQAVQEAEWKAEQSQRVAAPPPPQPPVYSGKEQVADYNRPLQPFARSEPKVGRNDPCPCGSGRKFKHCHGKKG